MSRGRVGRRSRSTSSRVGLPRAEGSPHDVGDGLGGHHVAVANILGVGLVVVGVALAVQGGLFRGCCGGGHVLKRDKNGRVSEDEQARRRPDDDRRTTQGKAN